MGRHLPKKRLGQHFLRNEQVVERIVALCNTKASDTVIEIGPGQGALTQHLAKTGASITAVEFDRDLIKDLSAQFSSSGNVQILNEDFLTFEPEAGPFILAGNIPYNLTSPIIDWCISRYERIRRAVLMVQMELAERICGSPGTKAWSPLSIMTQLHFDAELSFDVPPSAFEPPPGVVSSVIVLSPPSNMYVMSHPEAFRRVIRSAFANRRKLLANNLSNGFDLDPGIARELVASAGFGVNSRAEELSIEQFLSLTEHLRAATIV